MTLNTGDKEEHFLVHRTKEEDDDRTRIYRETERDNGHQFGRPGRKPFLWPVSYTHLYYQAKVVCNCGNEFVTGSTKQDIHVEVCSKCCLLYTSRCV